jgi:diguanylate cyclase (GGDEF)-like protein
MGRRMTIQVLAAAAAASTAAAITVAARHSRTRAQLTAARYALTHDDLTGVLNRAGFYERAEQVATSSTAMTIGILDANRFKKVNDTYGHDGGNAVLRSATALLVHLLGEENLVARLHGDELAILAPAARVTRFLGEGLAVRAEYGRDRITCSFSLGTTDFDPTLPVSEQLRRADLALYSAKLNGGGRACYTTAMDGTFVASKSERPQVKRLDLAREVAAMESVDVLA